MIIINPDDEKDYENFLRDWNSHYTSRNPVKPPSKASMRILFYYATQGHLPGEFVLNVLQNSLYESFGTIPNDEIDSMYGLVQYVTTYLPSEAYGSHEKVARYIERAKKKKMFVPTQMY